jgi:hypothetical protein
MGTADWEQWGLAAATAVNRKAGVATQISGLTQLGAAPAFFAADPRFNSLSWTDGTDREQVELHRRSLLCGSQQRL